MKKIKKNMSNEAVYSIADFLNTTFKDEVFYLSAIVNFFLHKNIEIFNSYHDLIEKTRRDIFYKYGEINEAGELKIPYTQVEEANKELQNLLEIDQEVEYYLIPLSALKDLKLSNKQMQAILFMIEDDTEQEEE